MTGITTLVTFQGYHEQKSKYVWLRRFLKETWLYPCRRSVEFHQYLLENGENVSGMDDMKRIIEISNPTKHRVLVAV
jgi:hypothetical protein